MNRFFALTVCLFALLGAGCKSGSSCPSGQVNADMGRCVPLAQSCNDTRDGGVASKCSSIHRACFGAGDTVTCGACVAGYTAPEGVCRPVTTCASLACAATGQTCTEGDAQHDAACGDCTAGLIKTSAGCATPTCDPGAAGSLVMSCLTAQRVCVPDSPAAHCGECYAGLKEDPQHVCVPVLVCAQLSCASQNRMCETETMHGDAACGSCLGGYKEVSGVCQVVANATCAPAPAAGSILDSCTSQNRACTSGTPATCGTCVTGFVEDTSTGKCLLTQDCASASCGTSHRECSTVPTGHCTTCSAGYVQDATTGLCRAALTCTDVICGVSDGGVQTQCTPSVVDSKTGVTTDAVCHASCPAGTTLWNGKDCTPCPPCDGPNDNGTESLPTSGGYCICKTKPGYFYSLGGNIGTFACDADSDGWVRESARGATTSADPVLKQNAHCTVRSVSSFQLFGEKTAPTTIPLAASVPLFETDRNDDDQLLKGSWQLHNLVSYTGATRDMTAAELNRMTKICHDPKNDYNDNGVPDVAEYPDESLSPTLLAEQRVFNRYSYFIELDWGAYLAPPAADATVTLTAGSATATGTGFSRSWVGQKLVDGITVLGTIEWVSDPGTLTLTASAATSFSGAVALSGFADGTYVIHERTRHTGAPERDSAAMPIDYGPKNGTYWRDCPVKQDTEWSIPPDGSDHSMGMELQGLTDPSGNVVVSGMNHHSQFKCTVIGDPDPAHPEVRSWDSLKTDKFVLDTCKGVYNVVNAGNVSGTTMHCSPTYDPSIGGGTPPAVGTVGWGAVPYTPYNLFFDKATYSAVQFPPPAPEYVRGCVNECESHYPACETAANVTTTQGNPAAATCNDDNANFGKFLSCTTTELCDGVDNNGDGKVDDVFPEKGKPCSSDVCKTDACICKPGTWICQSPATPSAKLFCKPNLVAVTEVCDGVDNNCNDQVDENDPVVGTACTVTDPVACGGKACVGACTSGTWTCDAVKHARYCAPSKPRNEDCVNGGDLDCDGVAYNAPKDGSCGGAFSQFYPDQDGDSYAAANATAQCFCNDTGRRPTGFGYYSVRSDSPSLSMRDYCDVCTNGQNLSEAAKVHPSTTVHTFVSTANCCGSFDWDSNGQQEQATTSIGSDSCHWSNFSCGSNSTTGWVLSSIPSCGQSAQYMNGGCHYVSGSGCYPDEVTGTQSCR